jgi:CheY-like chemotaxis protein
VLYVCRDLDDTPPAAVSSFTATPGEHRNTLIWTNPSSTNFIATVIRCKTTGYPTSPTDGEPVVNLANMPGSSHTYVHSGLSAGVTYYYTAFARDDEYHYSSGVQAGAIPHDHKRVSVDLGTTDIEQGIYNVQPSDGDTVPADVGGRNCRRNAVAGNDNYMYFNVTDAYMYAGYRPVCYVSVEYYDTGTGILPAILEHIFEPFNTIKPDGTGLGLSIVHSIVKQFGGHISVESEPGRGTTFRIYFPIETREAETGEAAEIQPVDLIPSGKATVLVVEDDPSVLNLIVDFLESLEYTVCAAASVDEAISIIEEPGRRVDLLISDVVLPGKKGTELAAMLKERHPEIKIMLMSGYADEKVPHAEILKSKIHFIAKPFSPLMLVMKVQEILEDSRTIL